MRWVSHINWIRYSLIGTLLFWGCSSGAESETTFIEDVLSSHSRMQVWPQQSLKTRQLLEKFKPRIFIAPDGYLPISFYRDYLPRCVVRNRKQPRSIHHPTVDPAMLREIQFSPHLYLDYLVSAHQARRFTAPEIHPEIYGRIYNDVLSEGDTHIPLVYLKYSLVFSYSGLPAGIGRLKRIGAHLIGDPTGWHELDIHGAVHIVLNGHNHEPLGVLLAQHNHHRFYLAHKEFQWPTDNRVPISFSQYSNEPYLMGNNDSYRLERTVGNPMHIAYLFGVTPKAPLGAGMDKIYSQKGGAREVDVELVLLPVDDPLYTAWIPLGNIEKIWGVYETWYRRGPPGIDFYTLGGLKNLADLTAFWYIDLLDKVLFQLLEESFHNFNQYDLGPVLLHQRPRLRSALKTVMGS